MMLTFITNKPLSHQPTTVPPPRPSTISCLHFFTIIFMHFYDFSLFHTHTTHTCVHDSLWHTYKFEHFDRMISEQTNMWFLDGVSCLGKTSFIAAANGLKLDYAERVKETPFFRNKSNSHIIQVLYTASFCAKLRSSSTTTAAVVVDRSPISDIWYEIIFKHYPDENNYIDEVFAMIEELNMFERIPTIFVQPHRSHAKTIVAKMTERANGLDHLNEKYVLTQIEVFDLVVRRFRSHPNVRVLEIDENMVIYSPEYFDWLRENLTEIIEEKESQD